MSANQLIGWLTLIGVITAVIIAQAVGVDSEQFGAWIVIIAMVTALGWGMGRMAS